MLRGLILAPQAAADLCTGQYISIHVPHPGPPFCFREPPLLWFTVSSYPLALTLSDYQPFMMSVRHPSPLVAHPPRAWAFSEAEGREVTHSGHLLTVEGILACFLVFLSCVVKVEDKREAVLCFPSAELCCRDSSQIFHPTWLLSLLSSGTGVQV